MKTSDKIGHSHLEEMMKIVDFIDSFNVHKLLYAISEKNLNEDDIVSITFDIRDKNLKLERQKTYLFNYTATCNREYALDDNKMVDSSARLSHRMRSGISGIKKTVRAFCKRSRQKLRPGQKEPQAIDRSLIATEAYMRDLFGLESYPNCVKELFSEMIGFFNNMNECLEEARRSLSEEKEIRGDKQRCLDLLQLACEKCRPQQEFLFEAMKNDPVLKSSMLKTKDLRPGSDNPVLKAWVDSVDDKETFASDYYHNCSPKDVSKITFYKTVSEAEGDRSLVSCMTVFDCDAVKAKQINYIISRFDSFLPETCKRNKIPATTLNLFKQWCSKGIGYETFLNYFNRHYKEAGGKWETIGKSALSGAATKHLHSPRKLTIERNFQMKLENLLKEQHI